MNFTELRRILNKLDFLSADDDKTEMTNVVESLDDSSARTLALMSAKRHTVKVAPPETKPFPLLENVIKGLLSEDCVDLAKQVVTIAPSRMINMLLIASVNRFNTVDQLAIRQTISAKRAAAPQSGESVNIELSPEDYEAAVIAARQAAEELSKPQPKDEKPRRGLFGMNKKR